jgi:hypothetical protein
MLQVNNQSPFNVSLSVFPDADGVETVYAIVKASFSLGPEPELLDKQVPLLATDVFWGDPIATSLRAAGEFALLKPSTDVLLTGHAVAPGPDTRIADVLLQVGLVRRSIRVFGDRHWEKSGGRWRPSAPQPWDRIPLRWERAWGGIAARAVGAQGEPEHEPRNPVGVGLVAKKENPKDGQPLPNLEDPRALLNDPADRPAPICFAPVAPAWLQRRQYAGTYDEAWVKSRAPYLPKDFDARFFHLAPPELIAPAFLVGGEPVQLAGFGTGVPLRFTLPECGLQLEFDFDGARLPGDAHLETVLFEPDLGRFQMLWRAALAVDKKLLRLKQLVVRSAVFDCDGSKRRPLQSMNSLPAAYAATE